MSKGNVPTHIRVDGLLLKRVDAPEPPPAGSGAMQPVWHALVKESETTSRHSPDMGDVVEEEGPSAVVLDLMAADKRTAVEAVRELMHAGSGPPGRWNLRIEKKLHQMSIDDAMQYIHDGWTHADELIGKLKEDGVVVLENNLDVRTAASPRQGFTVEDAERAATDMGLDWNEASYDVEQLRMGMDVELEHGKRHQETNVTNDDPVKTAQIAWAHLMEIPDYYDRLARMEQEGKAALAAREPSGEVGIVDVEEDMPKHPKFVSVNGSLYALEQEAPEHIEVGGKRFRKSSVAAIREAKAWSKLPKGWTKESAKQFCNSLSKTDSGKKAKHKVTECIRKMKDTEVDDPGAFCASLADKIEGPAWRHKSRKKKKKKEARIDYTLPDNHPQLPMQYNRPVTLEGVDVARLQERVHRGGTSPSYALLSRLNAYGTTVASEQELEDTIDALQEDGSPEALDAAEQLQRA